MYTCDNMFIKKIEPFVCLLFRFNPYNAEHKVTKKKSKIKNIRESCVYLIWYANRWLQIIFSQLSFMNNLSAKVTIYIPKYRERSKRKKPKHQFHQSHQKIIFWLVLYVYAFHFLIKCFWSPFLVTCSVRLLVSHKMLSYETWDISTFSLLVYCMKQKAFVWY